jgi:hypothetical protein
MRLEEAMRMQDDLVEINEISPAERGGILGKDGLVPGVEAIRLQPVPPEEVEQGTMALDGDAQATEERPLILLVGDAESRAQTRLLRMSAQDLDRQGVQGAPRHVTARWADHPLEAIGDLARGLVGERDRADPIGGVAMGGDQVPDPADQAERLAGAGTGQNEHGPGSRFDRSPLGWRGGEVFGRCSGLHALR